MAIRECIEECTAQNVCLKIANKALERWADVEKKSGTKLLQENCLLFYGEDTGETVE